MSLQIGKRYKITIGPYSSRCGAAKRPYGIYPERGSNMGYIVVLEGQWKYNSEGGFWEDPEGNIISENDSVWVEINSCRKSIYYATLL